MTKFRIPLLCLLITGCTYYENEPVKAPVQEKSDATTTLEAKLVTTSPNRTTSSYWKTADYLPLVVQNQVTSQVPAADGLFNMSGTLSGLTDFNQGKNPNVRLQAAYTADSLYVLVSWMDTLYNASNSNWLYDGPADPDKAGSTTGWTSQRADDNFFLSFDMGSSKRDIWNWSLSLSEPMGYALDLIDNGSGASPDAGTPAYVRNAISDNRSGPQYEWNDTEQELTRKYAGSTVLDPGYYLTNKKTFSGDIIAGDAYYQIECACCHGPSGGGEGAPCGYETGVRLDLPGQFLSKWTRQALDAYAPSADHEGAVHYPPAEIDRTNLYARLRGLTGIPGYYLQTPTGSSADIHAASNVVIAKIPKYNKKYTVLLVRALNTTQSDDIVLNPATATYAFNFSVRDNDLINQIGSINQILTFKP